MKRSRSRNAILVFGLIALICGIAGSVVMPEADRTEAAGRSPSPEMTVAENQVREADPAPAEMNGGSPAPDETGSETTTALTEPSPEEERDATDAADKWGVQIARRFAGEIKGLPDGWPEQRDVFEKMLCGSAYGECMFGYQFGNRARFVAQEELGRLAKENEGPDPGKAVKLYRFLGSEHEGEVFRVYRRSGDAAAMSNMLALSLYYSPCCDKFMYEYFADVGHSLDHIPEFIAELRAVLSEIPPSEQERMRRAIPNLIIRLQNELREKRDYDTAVMDQAYLVRLELFIKELEKIQRGE